MANQLRSRSLRCSRLLRTLLVGAVVPYAFNAVLFTGGCAPHTVHRRTRTVARNADPPQAQPELPPFQRFPDDYNPDNSDPLDRAIEWFMTLDPETNSRLETVFTLIVLAITVISAKETYEKWLREKTEEDNLSFGLSGLLLRRSIP